MHEAGLDPNHNRWDVIFDFTEKEVDGVKVSNFSTLDPSQFSIHSIQVEGDETEPSQLPVPQKYGGTLADNDLSSQQHHGMAEFSIFTSAQEAQKKFEEMQERTEHHQVPVTVPQEIHHNFEPVQEHQPTFEEPQPYQQFDFGNEFNPKIEEEEPIFKNQQFEQYSSIEHKSFSDKESVWMNQVDDGFDDEEREQL